MLFNPAAASDRPLQTIHAASVFHDRVFAIGAACADALENELVVAAVSAEYVFRGVWTAPKAELTALITRLDDGGWTMIFSPGVEIDEIEDRCLGLANIAFDRWKGIRQWVSTHRGIST